MKFPIPDGISEEEARSGSIHVNGQHVITAVVSDGHFDLSGLPFRPTKNDRIAWSCRLAGKKAVLQYEAQPVPPMRAMTPLSLVWARCIVEITDDNPDDWHTLDADLVLGKCMRLSGGRMNPTDVLDRWAALVKEATGE